ncbi:MULTISPECIES: hypothetical protein [Vibrio]|jgi:hypothetical protein|uniref:Uncharacterized protein n=2 Tax=Vibrio campbellii TaxID=680 RepID=A0ACC7R5S5_9VIBR|nr:MULTISPECIES: hypothetical protein [Vibrio]EDL70568.1 hypothetical protein A1Q_0920 [Vibrio campbellii HY01]APX08584.1 hypothetical protein BWP24_20580 [Vibrio campbellii]AQM70616.1 hypothetical protein Vca1114GL_04191 [Vibrio campbellii]ARR09210.1 hypothetical protein Vc3S01_A1237 [Vibrio campbellii]ARR46031.1 hypothetical protein CAY59_17135 [Vibrio campbellii]
MNNTNFKELIDSLKDLTPTQKKYLISQTRLSLEESEVLKNKDLLTPEELELLLAVTNEK